jgi:predicted ester cyclase
MQGKAAGKRYFGELTRAFPDVKATTTNAWGVGDYVIAEATLSGTYRAAFFGVPPTNKAIRLHALDILQFKDGTIVKGWSYGNGREMTAPPAAGPAAPTKR